MNVATEQIVDMENTGRSAYDHFQEIILNGERVVIEHPVPGQPPTVLAVLSSIEELAVLKVLNIFVVEIGKSCQLAPRRPEAGD
ncbi:MAG: hypothetical protein JWR26_4271 [Pedosphaera sp.]|nr:hypothetical protein [Pedosphaera sp.]